MENLKAISPALLSLCRRNLEPEHSKYIDRLAGELIPSLNEYPIERAEGASYNPRPARLLDILVRNGAVYSIDVFAAAFVIGSGVTQPPQSLGAESLEIFRSTKLVLKDPNRESSKNTITLAAVFMLDLIRHLHMTSLTDIEKISEVQRAKAIYERLPDGRLKVLLRTATRRYSIT